MDRRVLEEGRSEGLKMNRLTVIQRIAQAIGAKTYLEIGVNNGEVFFALDIPEKYAVDPHFNFSARANLHRLPGVRKGLYKNAEYFFEETSDNFFEKHCDKLKKSGLDLAFVDGLHTYRQSYRDVINCLNYLNPNGVLVVHDTNPATPAIATPVINAIDEVLQKAQRGEIPGWTGNWSGDVWKTIVALQCERDDLNVVTLDIDWGVSVIMKTKNDNRLSVTSIDGLGYKDLEANRAKWLNLKEPLFLNELTARLKK